MKQHPNLFELCNHKKLKIPTDLQCYFTYRRAVRAEQLHKGWQARSQRWQPGHTPTGFEHGKQRGGDNRVHWRSQKEQGNELFPGSNLEAMQEQQEMRPEIELKKTL